MALTPKEQQKRWSRDQKPLILAMIERRRLLDLSCQAVAEQSGFYSRAMISVLETSLKPTSKVRPRMSSKGMGSIRKWLHRTEAKAKRLRREYLIDRRRAA